MLEENALNLPTNNEDVLEHFVADDAFGLSSRIMKPFPHKSLDPKQRIFNYRYVSKSLLFNYQFIFSIFSLSRARRTVENAFGIMSGKFRLLRRPIDQHYENAVKSVKAITVLHNFLRERSLQNGEKISDSKCSDVFIESKMDSISSGKQFNGSGTAGAKAMRDHLAEYFYDKGQVKFQWSRTFGK